MSKEASRVANCRPLQLLINVVIGQEKPSPTPRGGGIAHDPLPGLSASGSTAEIARCVPVLREVRVSVHF